MKSCARWTCCITKKLYRKDMYLFHCWKALQMHILAFYLESWIAPPLIKNNNTFLRLLTVELEFQLAAVLWFWTHMKKGKDAGLLMSRIRWLSLQPRSFAVSGSFFLYCTSANTWPGFCVDSQAVPPNSRRFIMSLTFNFLAWIVEMMWCVSPMVLLKQMLPVF